MVKKEWFEKEKPKKEITIKFKLNTGHLKHAIYILVILLLILVISLQHYGVIPARDAVGAATKVIDTEDEEEQDNTSSGITIIKAGENKTINQTETNSSEEEPEPEDETLPITGEIIFTLDKLNLDPKPKIDDYAKVSSVEFTIKNQDKDIIPKVVAYLTEYGGEDEKIIIYDELEAGETLTLTESKFAFGFNNVDQSHELNLELYSGKKLIKKITKTFTSDD
ncbi:MAG: hypothetical protein V3V78_01535 [Candidatus Woesearchaeota archaeon]